MYFKNWPGNFLKISCFLPKYINQLRQHFEKEIINFQGKQGVFSEVTYESNIPYGIRFMIETKMTGMCWLKIPKKTFKIREEATQ